MGKASFLVQQFKENSIAIISLFVAIVALTHTAWREQETERNRNIRPAAYEVLKHLGELQIIINYSHFQPKNNLGDPFMGWGHIALIRDLAQILPSPLPQQADQLVEVWQERWKEIKTDLQATEAVSKEVDTLRESTVHLMLTLR